MGFGGENFVVMGRVLYARVFSWGYCVFFFLTQGVFTLIFNFRTLFCCLVLAGKWGL